MIKLMSKRITNSDAKIALLGNPNVGKSSIFNTLTGLSRHTGNWSGKTVDSSLGKCKHSDLLLADLPGTYSLTPRSSEEEVALDFLVFENPKKTVVVCSATCLMRNMILLLEAMEITQNTVLCINMMDEAKKEGIYIDTKKLADTLKIPVITVSARKGEGIKELISTMESDSTKEVPYLLKYTKSVEDAISALAPHFSNNLHLPERWLALRLLSGDHRLFQKIKKEKGVDFLASDSLSDTLLKETEKLKESGISKEKFTDIIASCRVLTAEYISESCQVRGNTTKAIKTEKLDRILTGKGTSTIVMLALLALIFWITLSGANIVSAFLSECFSLLLKHISNLLTTLNVPEFIKSPLVDGVLHVLFRVVSVMLPPMAIFFPLFTLLEDLGYLPRVAFNLDRYFKKCSSCGKQAYSMCMGFGCNAAGVTGCRIIDSKRERIIAILTNCLVPCNGKFPALTTLITLFLIAPANDEYKSLLGALILTLIVTASVLMTFLVSKILSVTLLKGSPSSFTLELPPYRRPEFFKILVRSFLDRGIFVLLRATVVAAPCGLLVWCMSNVSIEGKTLLLHASEFLHPVGKLMGLDGTILLAFILGFPANEIVIPLIVTGYSALGTLAPDTGLSAIGTLFRENGWTMVTAVNVLIFMLFHWPCSTTLITIKKETKSTKLTVLSFVIPTLIGFTLCILINFVSGLFI
ncbi:MAG: ferrous iron transport protein B [Ruminococcaceae bacterium]|nr:ferrous iron transport protein B [Oscillospiraceae bacterium]